ncbi:MAG: riboflavin synthase [Acidobacteriota bacterium]|nr:riboflavin synthase [Acidobacteriota bacterium]
MFTGLIETTGTFLSATPTAGATRVVIASPKLAGRWRIGDSIAVNGVCLTALDVEETAVPHPARFAADLATETVDRTTLSHLEPGSLVNLELPTPSGAPMGGHIVQGHVDATGTLVSLIALHPGSDFTDWRMTIELPDSLTPYVVPQGSITIDGISLTVARVEDRRIEIAIVPHTYKSTNLRGLLAGSSVNIEADVMSKYAERRNAIETPSIRIAAAKATPFQLTADYLLRNGY